MSLIMVRTDKDGGAKELVEWDVAARAIENSYVEPAGILRRLAHGYEIDTTFATFQHRDFVKGFERQGPEDAESIMHRFKDYCVNVEHDPESRGYWDFVLNHGDKSYFETPVGRKEYLKGYAIAESEINHEISEALEGAKKPTPITPAMRKLMQALLWYRFSNYYCKTMSDHGGMTATVRAGVKRGWLAWHKDYGITMTIEGRRVAAQNEIFPVPIDKKGEQGPI